MGQKFSAIYLRVSTKRQDVASQKPDLERWQAGHDGPVKWYADQFTGKTLARPAWQRVEQAIREGRVSTVVVWRLDRLGRTARGLTALFDDLRTLGVNVVSLKDGFDLSTASGRLMANMLASIAQFETELRAERILAGQDVARAAGKRWGGSKPGRRLKVTPEQATAVARLRSEGTGIAAIARATGLSRPTVYSLLPSD